ncbi:TonB-dependent receptor domain-containing protein [Methylibium sp.]|uniref:TonB-dependent receptor n=1 Tax=Methylibium sp. TaxID=2067992 RepID=UPI003BA88F38
MNLRQRPPCKPSPLHRAVLAALTLTAPLTVLAQQAPDVAASAPEAAPPAAAVRLNPVLVPGKRATDVGPMPGLAVTKDQIPANIQSATKEQIKESRALNIGDYMNTQLQGVSVNDYSGNPFQMDVNYRGFTASPQIGTPQGLSVFFDGVRVNEPFGDVVNWDLIPLNAIERFDLFPGSNPLFGLNTLGGAISVRSKSGFTAPGVEGSVLGGSFGRRQLQLSGGGNDGTLAGFGALTIFKEDGWRDNSPSQVRQFFGRGDMAFERGSLTVGLLAADNKLIGNGLLPTELFNQRSESVFTSPDHSKNSLVQFTLSGAFDVSSTQSVTGRAYHRKSNRTALNGDIYEGFDDFSGTDGLDVVFDPSRPIGDQYITRNGAKQFGPLGAGFAGATGAVDGTPIGLLTDTSLRQTTDGLAFQYNWNLERHKLMVGAAIDRSRATYLMTQRLGLIDASHNVYADTDSIDPIYYAASHDVPGNDFNGSQTTKSLYFSETWSPREDLHFTGSARYNHTTTDSDLYSRASAAQRDLHELRSITQGLDQLVNAKVLTSEAFRYTSFNPSIGVNWLPTRDVNLYGSLSRGSRVPSVVELGCAFDDTPVELTNGQVVFGTAPRSLLGPGCSLPTTLSGDPYLKQIRSTSGEVGVRGQLARNWEWNASVYRTDLKDDIYFVGVGDGKSFFDTIGKTRRQGMELGLSGRAGLFDVRLSYSYTDATFQSTFYTLSPHNSSADFNANSQAIGNRPELSQAGGTLPSPTANANGGRGTYRMIRVDPGSKLPGIPEHALNGSLALHATEAFKVGLGVQIRSSSFVRGNENNQHRTGGTDQEIGQYYCPSENCLGGYIQEPVRPGRAFNNSGRLPGYAIFSLDTSYKVNRQLDVFLQVSNLFDRRYFTAGRLGVNPFSPSVNGAIGPSGWNYNSAEWQNTTYVGAGAPRGVWVGLNYELDPK